jgi:hypothetical protein
LVDAFLGAIAMQMMIYSLEQRVATSDNATMTL